MANTYDPSTIILGDECFVYTNEGTDESPSWEPIAYTTSCSLSIQGDSIDVSSKMDGVWSSVKPGKMSWSISSENFVAGATSTTFDYFYNAMVNRTAFLIRFGFCKSNTGVNPDYTLDETKSTYEGKAYLTSCELSADNGAAISVSVELSGNGPLTLLS